MAAKARLGVGFLRVKIKKTLKLCGCGETGRRAGFRFLWVTPCGFESLHPHQRENAPLWGALFLWADEGCEKVQIIVGSREERPKGRIRRKTRIVGATTLWRSQNIHPHHKETIILIRKISVLWLFYCQNGVVLPFFIEFIAKM